MYDPYLRTPFEKNGKFLEVISKKYLGDLVTTCNFAPRL